jgi:hypothetical protein
MNESNMASLKLGNWIHVPPTKQGADAKASTLPPKSDKKNRSYNQKTFHWCFNKNLDKCNLGAWRVLLTPKQCKGSG